MENESHEKINEQQNTPVALNDDNDQQAQVNDDQLIKSLEEREDVEEDDLIGGVEEDILLEEVDGTIENENSEDEEAETTTTDEEEPAGVMTRSQWAKYKKGRSALDAIDDESPSGEDEKEIKTSSRRPGLRPIKRKVG